MRKILVVELCNFLAKYPASEAKPPNRLLSSLSESKRINMGGYQKFKTERLYSDILDAFDIKEKPLLYSS